MGSCRFSNVTKDYLTAFFCILGKMEQEMTAVDLNSSISGNFILQMIPHHQAAIEMSRNILKYTTNLPLQEIAEGIVTEQTRSIAKMQAALGTCEQKCNEEQEVFLYQRRVDQIMKTMFCRMSRARSTNDINANFMREMIPHHQGAVEMSENALHYAICPELVPILEAIITSQKRGIAKMQCLLRQIS